MTVDAQCATYVRGRMLRVTRLDSCGDPLPQGTFAAVGVTDGFIEVSYTPQYTNPAELTRVSGSGTLCLDRVVAAPQLLRYDVKIRMCGIDPEILALLDGAPTVVDGAGDLVGWIDDDTQGDTHYALEVWAGVAGAECGAGEEFGYLLLPHVVGTGLGEATVNLGPLTFEASGYTDPLTGWGVGPYLVAYDGATPTGMPVPVADGDHKRLMWTTYPPPDAACGLAPMPDYGNTDVDAPAAHVTVDATDATVSVSQSDTADAEAALIGVDAPDVTVTTSAVSALAEATFVTVDAQDAQALRLTRVFPDAADVGATAWNALPINETVVIDALTSYTGTVSGGPPNTVAGAITAMSDGSDTTFITRTGAGVVPITLAGVGFAPLVNVHGQQIRAFCVRLRWQASSGPNSEITAVSGVTADPATWIMPFPGSAGVGVLTRRSAFFYKAGGGTWSAADINGMTVDLEVQGVNFPPTVTVRLYEVSLQVEYEP